MAGKKVEACGRCSITTVVEVAGGDEGPRDVFGDRRIEVEEGDLKRVSRHHLAASRVKDRLNDLGLRLTFGR